jgi:hypothetical protein
MEPSGFRKVKETTLKADIFCFLGCRLDLENRSKSSFEEARKAQRKFSANAFSKNDELSLSLTFFAKNFIHLKIYA